jgi:hypothetical protein
MRLPLTSPALSAGVWASQGAQAGADAPCCGEAAQLSSSLRVLEAWNFGTREAFSVISTPV